MHDSIYVPTANTMDLADLSSFTQFGKIAMDSVPLIRATVCAVMLGTKMR
jgi:hypothetical protein